MAPTFLLSLVSCLVLFTAAGCTGPGPSTDLLANAPQTVNVASGVFQAGGPIPVVHSCHGENTSPQLAIDELPAGAVTVALIMDDPDAPRGPFTHWIFWDLPRSHNRLATDEDVTASGAREGTNSADEIGYTGPCPPSGTHRYRFYAFAVDGTLGLPSGADVTALRGILSGHVLAWGLVEGTFSAP